MNIRTIPLFGESLLTSLEWQGAAAKTLMDDGRVKVHLTSTTATTFTIRFAIPIEPLTASKITAVIDIEDSEGEKLRTPLTLIRNGSGIQYFYVPVKSGMHTLIVKTFNGSDFETMKVQLEGLPTNKDYILNSVVINIMG